MKDFWKYVSYYIVSLKKFYVPSNTNFGYRCI